MELLTCGDLGELFMRREWRPLPLFVGGHAGRRVRLVPVKAPDLDRVIRLPSGLYVAAGKGGPPTDADPDPFPAVVMFTTNPR